MLPSSEHSKLAWSSVDEKRNSAVVLRLEVGPETIVVSGATTVHVRLAGVGSTFPDGVVAATSSVYVPGSRPSTACGGSQELHERPPSSEHSKVAGASGSPVS